MSPVPIDSGNPDKPVITLIGPRAVNQPLNSTYVDPGATASDPHDGDITSRIAVTGLSDLNTEIAGDYLIRYNVANAAQLAAVEVVRLVRVSAGAFPAQTARDIGTTKAHMGYYEHLPLNYGDDPAQTFPVIVFQHGWGVARFTEDGASKNGITDILLGDIAKLIHDGLWDNSRPFIVLSPQRCREPEDSATALRTKLFIDYALNTYKIDSSRIYMSGYSEGSYLTWQYVLSYPHQVAAVVPMSGGGSTSQGCVLKETPAWAFAAANDATSTDQARTVASINACNPAERARLTIFPTGGHNVQEEFLTIGLTGLGQGLAPYDVYDQNIYDWLLQHSRSLLPPESGRFQHETRRFRTGLPAPHRPW